LKHLLAIGSNGAEVACTEVEVGGHAEWRMEKILRADLCGKSAVMQPWREEIRKFRRNASGALAKRGASE
jgi:hypothetical protein